LFQKFVLSVQDIYFSLTHTHTHTHAHTHTHMQRNFRNKLLEKLIHIATELLQIKHTHKLLVNYYNFQVFSEENIISPDYYINAL